MGNQKKAEVEKELVTLEEKIDDFRQSKFGVNGELYKKQEEFMKPIQNQVFTAIEEVAVEKELDFVFDRSTQFILIYSFTTVKQNISISCRFSVFSDNVNIYSSRIIGKWAIGKRSICF